MGILYGSTSLWCENYSQPHIQLGGIESTMEIAHHSHCQHLYHLFPKGFNSPVV
jgi:hypothetical protein